MSIKQLATHLKEDIASQENGKERQSPPLKELVAECNAASEGKFKKEKSGGTGSDNAGMKPRNQEEEVHHEYNKGSAPNQQVSETN